MVLWTTACLCENLPQEAQSADVLFLGEFHDNPHHHARQAAWVAAAKPTALVFEMLPEDVTVPRDVRGNEAALEAQLAWEDRGWPDFSMYYPIFAAAPNAAIFGAAVPRDMARALMEKPLAEAFGPESGRLGLDKDLPAAQQSAREALQQVAHCNAMPEEMLPIMVDIQRLRDAALAKAVLNALDVHGPPVVVITGNGHVRKDWGAPVALAEASNTLQFSLGQSEDGRPPSGTFDLILDSPGVERGDPCEAFR